MIHESAMGEGGGECLRSRMF